VTARVERMYPKGGVPNIAHVGQNDGVRVAHNKAAHTVEERACDCGHHPYVRSTVGSLAVYVLWRCTTTAVEYVRSNYNVCRLCRRSNKIVLTRQSTLARSARSSTRRRSSNTLEREQ